MELRDALRNSPSLFPLNWDKTAQAIQFVQLSEADYAAASFLDQRLLSNDSPTAMIPWTELAPAAVGLAAKCHFIFHISHAGSTLMSRLLGSHREVLSVREPAILRWLAEGTHAERTETFLGLWSRVFRSEQTALIKATSFVSEVGVQLMQLVPHSRSLLMFVPLSSFLPSMLDGVMQDIAAHVETRARRLGVRLNWPEWSQGRTSGELSSGELVAMSWLTEMLALHDMRHQFPDRTWWLDFEQLLAAPREGLIHACQLLNIDPDVEPLLLSPLWTRYAKRLEVQYDARFRQKLIDQAEAKHAEEIRRGRAWIQRCIDRLPPAVAAAIE